MIDLRSRDINRLGFMQGRLSPPVDGKIQSFPWEHWRIEFPAAEALGLRLMEWTLDHERLSENPLMTESGRAEITRLSVLHKVSVLTLTGDLFMQSPFWKTTGAERKKLLKEFDELISACSLAGIRHIVVPLVDGGRLETDGQKQLLIGELRERQDALARMNVKIAFESDLEPRDLAAFMKLLPADSFSINYDTGNSASLGFSPHEEIVAYVDRISNVHIKDRLFKGTTVPLGEGAALLPTTIDLLESAGYRGNYILQTARAEDGDHAGALGRYRDMWIDWLERTHAA